MKKIVLKTIILFITLSLLILSKSFGATTLTTSNPNSANTYNAKASTPKVDETLKVYDYANLLSDAQEESLRNEIKTFIDSYKMDMIIVTISENNKPSSMSYADDFYDYNNFGINSNKSGLLFLIDMDTRNMWISTTGSAINMYNDKRIDNILDFTYDKISKKDYYGCTTEFIRCATEFAKKGVNGTNFIKTPKIVIITILSVSGLVTLIFIIIGVCKHRTVKKQSFAKSYITQPLNLSENHDHFVTKHLSKSRHIESSSGGSSTHSGSSGISHGGGRKKFLKNKIYL